MKFQQKMANMEEGRQPIEYLPAEVKVKIAGFLYGKDLFSLAQCNKELMKIARESLRERKIDGVVCEVSMFSALHFLSKKF